MISKLKSKFFNKLNKNKIIEKVIVKDKIDHSNDNFLLQYQLSSNSLVVEYNLYFCFEINNNRDRLVEFLSKNISSNAILLHGEAIPIKVTLFQYHGDDIYKISEKTYNTIGISEYSKSDLKREIGKLRVSNGDYLIQLEFENKIKDVIDSNVYVGIKRKEEKSS